MAGSLFTDTVANVTWKAALFNVIHVLIPSVQLWGAITFHDCCHLICIMGRITSQLYITDVLVAELLPFLQTIPGCHLSTWQCPTCPLCTPRHMSSLTCALTRFISNRKWERHHCMTIRSCGLNGLSPPMNYEYVLKHTGMTFCRRPSRITLGRRLTMYGPSSLFVVGSQHPDFSISFSTYRSVTVWLRLLVICHINFTVIFPVFFGVAISIHSSVYLVIMETHFRKHTKIHFLAHQLHIGCD